MGRLQIWEDQKPFQRQAKACGYILRLHTLMLGVQGQKKDHLHHLD